MRAVFHANTSWYIWNFRRSTIQRFVSCGYDVVVVCGDDKYFQDLTQLGVEFRQIHVPLNAGSLYLLFKYVIELRSVLKSTSVFSLTLPRSVIW